MNSTLRQDPVLKGETIYHEMIAAAQYAQLYGREPMRYEISHDRWLELRCWIAEHIMMVPDPTKTDRTFNGLQLDVSDRVVGIVVHLAD